jgi:tRNA(Ile)-lysidine synthase TilS/MesJ
MLVLGHHQDDLLETALFNLTRGTGPRGLCSMLLNEKILRPLIGVSKQEIFEYAVAKKLEWVQDSTNLEDKYTRNKIRKYVVPKLTYVQKERMFDIIHSLAKIVYEIDSEMDGLLKDGLQTKQYLGWPLSLQRESLVYELKRHDLKYDSNIIDYLQKKIAGRRTGFRLSVGAGAFVEIKKEFIRVIFTDGHV